MYIYQNNLVPDTSNQETPFYHQQQKVMCRDKYKMVGFVHLSLYLFEFFISLSPPIPIYLCLLRIIHVLSLTSQPFSYFTSIN